VSEKKSKDYFFSPMQIQRKKGNRRTKKQKFGDINLFVYKLHVSLEKILIVKIIYGKEYFLTSIITIETEHNQRLHINRIEFAMEMDIL
jgi:hypothetical protein